MNKNIVLCGVGGQGIVLASKLIASAAMEKGIPVMSAETIGMAQRGGSVFSHLRMGDDLYSPMIAYGTADLLIGFEPGEAVRRIPYLKKGGQIIVSSRPVMPVTAALSGVPYREKDMLAYLKSTLANLTIVDTEDACRKIGSSKILNILLLGAAVHSGVLDISEEDIKNQIRKKLPEKFHELNFSALEYVRNNTSPTSPCSM